MKATSLTILRKRLGHSQRHMAELLGIGRRSLSNYESDATPVPRVVALACAALAFGLPAME